MSQTIRVQQLGRIRTRTLEKEELKIDFRIQGIPQAAVDQEDDRTRGIKKVSASIQKAPEQGYMKRRSAEKLHVQSLQCRIKEGHSQFGEHGVLRVVRNYFQDPVLYLFKILGRRHRLLHLWDLLDTYRVHETIDQRQIRHIIHPVLCFETRIAPWCSLKEN